MSDLGAVDTEVPIWHLRGYAQAARGLDQLDVLALPKGNVNQFAAFERRVVEAFLV